MRTTSMYRLSGLVPLVLAGAVVAALAHNPSTSTRAAGDVQHAMTQRHSHRVRDVVPPLPPQPTPGPVSSTPSNASGIPAIQLSNGPVADISKAAFTEDVVRAHLATHQYFQSADGTPPSIAKILFIPASQASDLLRGESIGRPGTALVCYVEIHGALSTEHLRLPATGTRAPRPASVGVLVFDAQTGNLLIRGFDD